MIKLEELQPNAAVRGILPDAMVSVVSVQWFGSEALELTYKTPAGKVANELLYRHDEPRLEVVEQGRPWSFDGDGALFRLVSEAQRIRLAHLFDPVLAVHTSVVEPLPHQITAVYEAMLPRQPLRFLLADDPGAGKTIMAGLLIKELIARGDLQRCLVVCPGSLAEQWQDELYRRFHLPFEILTNDKLEAARTGNWFLETNLVIARLDKLSRNEDVQQKLQAPDCRWDLVVCDEAHKMSATFFGGEVKYTKRYRLGQLLSTLTRHFLLMTATPHNGKEEDFQLFMALLDGDRFEGRFRDGVHVADVSDLMRRMVKENLLKFDGTPLFPERIAYTVPYKLSDAEAQLYKAVTEYVREEFNRAEALENDKRAGTVGFALTILQRRLASSPEAIYQSLRRRRERLESRLRELELLQRGGQVAPVLAAIARARRRGRRGSRGGAGQRSRGRRGGDPRPGDRGAHHRRAEDRDRDAEGPGSARPRRPPQRHGHQVARAGEPARRDLHAVGHRGSRRPNAGRPYGAGKIPPPKPSPHQKLVIFTEHRDTLNYLEARITTLLGRKEAVVMIHGGMGREERMKAQESFRHDPEVQVLLATDAAGEGINLQRAHLMVNYDLPWNPNRLEQRFGRIHRIGQTEVCHLWNLVAEETREGDVYRKLLEKLEEARKALGGQVFDVLGKLQFEGTSAARAADRGHPLRRPARGARPADARWSSNALDRDQLQDLLEERALAHDAMDASRVHRIREDMERAEARRLQPHYIESFFLEAFQRLGGIGQAARAAPLRGHPRPGAGAQPRPPDRHRRAGAAPLRAHRLREGAGRAAGPAAGRLRLPRPSAARRGHRPHPRTPPRPAQARHGAGRRARLRDPAARAVLPRARDPGREPHPHRASGGSSPSGCSTSRSTPTGTTRHLHYAPYLDYRPLADGRARRATRSSTGPSARGSTARSSRRRRATRSPSRAGAPRRRCGTRKLELIAKTEAAVKDRLTKEITYWDHRAEQLKLQEQAGKPNARLNSGEARKRADDLQGRLQKRHGGAEARSARSRRCRPWCSAACWSCPRA